MSPQGLREFLDGPYNRIADVKMYLFFAPISLTALSVVLGLTLLSFFVKNFWCRYLCPYGALLGLLSWTSPAGIRREGAFCTRCGRCDKACPNRIRISGKRFVRSEECTACLQCTQTCPERGALAFGLSQRRLRLKEEVFAMLVILAFVFLPRLFSAAGYWHTDTPPMMYKALYRMHHEIDHPR
jgi:polyferredoxin